MLLFQYICISAAVSNGKWETEARAIFSNPSSCKLKFVFCLFLGEETNGSHPFSNGLSGLNGLPIYSMLLLNTSLFVCILEA
jgi:hypothetical protein